MVAVPLKPQYRPTLAQLLAPGWRRTSRAVRLLVVLTGLVLAVAVAGLTFTLLPAHYSRGGPVPFSFSYKSLYRTAPDPGGYVKVARRSASGRLLYSFAVAPIELPPYQGDLSGELPLYATSYIRALAARYPGFVLQGEGKTRVNTVPVYNVYYYARVQGRPMYARSVLVAPERPGSRHGLAITMLTAPDASAQVTAPLLVAGVGVLQEPLRTFSFS
jgi:hypothetical protein